MKKKRVLAGVLVLVLVIGSLYLLQRLLVPKYQTGIVEGSMVEEYYKDKSDHEVLFVGDCEVYENFSTITLWENYGITSYIRGSAQQLTWQSYYLLEDALRYETPKVVVFNVLALKYNEPQSEAYNRMSIDGMKWSSSKINNIMASMTKEENLIDYMFPLLRYHSRWSELNSDDFEHIFSKDLVTHNGYYMRVDSKAQGEFPTPTPLADYTLGEKAMGYMQKMADLCKEKGIELVLIKAPTEFPHWYDEWDAQVVEFAEENGLEYINYIPLQEEIGLDMSVDTYDAGLHLNTSGAEKMADYFGAWLVENYDLTDYRQDEEVAAIWQEKVDFYNEMKQAQYDELEQYGELRSFGANAIQD
ncbi:MAG: SGNH/GDSL hydrolase family protein [Agathobacter sp.]|nr:SGNH/GDSL hydrolase family protein [Agathobacter sp.]MBQ2283104.1 SGNH/GDSL hydrolase family protein [Agathobacter sp.]